MISRPRERNLKRIALDICSSLLSRFTHFCVEKNLFRNCACGEKRTNIRYVLTQEGSPIRLAEVDASKEKILAKKEGVRS